MNTREYVQAKAESLCAVLNQGGQSGWEPDNFNVTDRVECRIAHPSSGVTIHVYKILETERCVAYYKPCSREIGTGATPQEALENLFAYWENRIEELQCELQQMKLSIKGDSKWK